MAEKATKKTATETMLESIKARVDAGEVLTLGALSQEFGRDVDDLTAKINDFFDEVYTYGNMGAMTFYKTIPVRDTKVAPEKEITPTKEQLAKGGKIYAYLAEKVAKTRIKDNEVHNYEIYCNPVVDDLVSHLNFMTKLYTKNSLALNHEADILDQLSKLVKNENDATEPMVIDIIYHLQHMAEICKKRSFRVSDTAETERIEGGDLVCLKK
jgi:hypothetical protein